MYKTCIFCQQQVLASEYSAHEAQHYQRAPARPLPDQRLVEAIPEHDWGPNASAQEPAVSSALPMIAIGGIALALLVSCSGLIGAGLFMAGQRGAKPVARPSAQQVRPMLPPAEQWPARAEPQPLANQPIVSPLAPPTIGPAAGPTMPGPHFGPSTPAPGGMAAEHARRHQQFMEENQRRMREMRERFRPPTGQLPQSITPLPRGPAGS